MARARYFEVAVDSAGRPVPSATVNVYQAGTVTPIVETIYAADSGATTLANPLTANAQGEIEFYLAAPKRVDLRWVKAGYTTESHPVDVVDADAWAAHAASGVAHSGAYAPLPDFPRTYSAVSVGTGAASVANRGEWVRAVGAGTITKIGIHVGVQSGNICVAVYANSGVGRAAKPAARKATSGSVACPATGFAEVALLASVAVEHGDWFFLAPDNGTATFTLCAATVTSAAADGLAWWAAASFPAPDPAPALTSGWSRPALMVGVA